MISIVGGWQMDELKIIAIVSSKKIDSSTKELTEKILQEVKELFYMIDGRVLLYEIVALRNYEIIDCIGCEECFKQGFCKMDIMDDFNVIRRKINESDIIFWCSPVYVANVSGTMKTFLDRCALSCHLLDLAGKLGYTIVVTQNTGGEETSRYLRSIQTSMGCKNLGNYIYTKELAEEKEMFTSRTAQNIYITFKNNYSLSDSTLEELYYRNREYYCHENMRFEVLNKFEFEYWNKIDRVKKCESFQEYAVENKKFMHQKDEIIE